MEILKHSANTISDIDLNYGVEIDVRDNGRDLVISHDLSLGPVITLNDYLKHFKKTKLIAINIKSVELEKKLKQILDSNNIVNYFTFDWPIPSLLKAIQIPLICAFRLSEYEKEFIPNCSWAWIDTFHSIWYDEKFLEYLNDKGIKIALVSPEIHHRQHELKKVKDIINTGFIDAICTDIPEYYE